MDDRLRAFFNDTILEEAAACFGLTIAELSALDGFENFIYEFERDGRGFILRITHFNRRTPAMIEAEMHWINFLHQHDVHCSLPLPSLHGKLVETVGSGDHTFVACAFDKVPGNRLTKAMDTPQFRFNYGRQIGRMHRVTRAYQPLETQRIPWYEDDLVHGFDDVIPADQSLVRERMRENTDSIKKMETNNDIYGLVHFDVHTYNFFVQADDIYIYDFDDSQYAFFAADIAIVLFYFAGACPQHKSREDFIREFFHEFMHGYESEYHLPASELAKIPIFLKQRELILYAAIMQAYPDGDYDAWANWYMTGRREKLENNVPFLDMTFELR